MLQEGLIGSCSVTAEAGKESPQTKTQVCHLSEEKGNEEVGMESLSCSPAMGKP